MAIKDCQNERVKIRLVRLPPSRLFGRFESGISALAYLFSHDRAAGDTF